MFLFVGRLFDDGAEDNPKKLCAPVSLCEGDGDSLSNLKPSYTDAEKDEMGDSSAYYSDCGNLSGFQTFDGNDTGDSSSFRSLTKTTPRTANSSTSWMDSFKEENEKFTNEVTQTTMYFEASEKTFSLPGLGQEELLDNSSNDNLKSLQRRKILQPSKKSASLLPIITEAVHENTQPAEDLDQFLKKFEENFLDNCESDNNKFAKYRAVESSVCVPNNQDKSPLSEDVFIDTAKEDFLDGALAAPYLGLQEPPKREKSLFPSLTESILSGETDSAQLQKKEVSTEVRRESLCLGRASLGGSGRRRSSGGGGRRMSQIFQDYEKRISDPPPGLLDISGSFLVDDL